MHDGFMYNPSYDYESNNLLDIGRMANVCLKCSALKWKGETPGMCCSSGKVKLPPILKPPEPLCSLLNGETAQSKDFVKHIRLFNNMFAMTSFKSNVVVNNGWTPTFKVKGQVYHHARPLYPVNANISRFTSWEKMSKCKDDWICLTVLLTETLFSNCKECCISITAM